MSSFEQLRVKLFNAAFEQQYADHSSLVFFAEGEDIFNIGARKVMHVFLNRFDRFHKLAVEYFPKKKRLDN